LIKDSEAQRTEKLITFASAHSVFKIVLKNVLVINIPVIHKTEINKPEPTP
jgi:hypothetical protein